MNQDDNDSPEGVPSQKTSQKRTFIIITGVILLVLIGVGVYAYMQMNDGRDTSKQAALQDDTSKVTDAEMSETDDMTTTTLPNGKVATYANTEANQNFTFKTSSKGADYVDVLYTEIDTYIANADPTTVQKLCGSDGEKAQIKDIVVATISTSARMIEYPTVNNCLDELATLRNSDATSRASATALIKQINTDIREFYRTVTIK